MSLGITEIILILIVVLLLFGAKRIPEIARSLGRAMHEFRKAKDEIEKESKDLLNAAEKNAETKDQKDETKNA